MNKYIIAFYHLYSKKSFRIGLLLLWIVLLSFSIYQMQYLKLAFDFESFFAQDSKDKQFYDQHKKAFGYDNDYLLLIIEAENGLFKKSIFTGLNEWQNTAQKIQGVEEINSPLSLKNVINTPLGFTAFPLIHYNSNSSLLNDSAKVYNHPLYSQFFSFKKQAMLVSIKHHHFTSKLEEETFLVAIQNSLKSSSLQQTSLIGRLTAQAAFVNNIKDDFLMFSVLALILSAIILWLIYRSIRLMLAPYLVSVSTMLITLGMTALFNISLSILSVLLPTIILFVATSDAIHLLNAFQKAEAPSFQLRILIAVKKVIRPTFLTSVTTAIGFASLVFLPSDPITELGYLAALAVVLAFFVNFIFSPLLFIKHPKTKLISFPYRNFTVNLFRYRKVVLSVFGILIFTSILLSLTLTTDSYLLKDLPENDPVRKDFELVDQYFGGSKPWEMAIWPQASEASIWDPSFLKEVNKISQYMLDSLGFGRVTSPDQLIRYANQVNNGGLVSYYHFPDSLTKQHIKTAQKLNTYLGGKIIQQDSAYSRILAFMPDWGASLTNQKNDRLVDFIESNIAASQLNYKITGTSYLIDKSNESVSSNLLIGLLLAILLISVVLAIYFKSLKIAFISLIPNLIPLLLTAGLMGLMQVPIKLTTTIIFVVAFSIAVDDTIHFIATYQQQKSTTHIWRIIHTLKTAGLAILMTTLIIVSGFSLFMWSDFATTFYLGCFLATALMFALITDIFLLPLLMKESK